MHRYVIMFDYILSCHIIIGHIIKNNIQVCLFQNFITLSHSAVHLETIVFIFFTWIGFIRVDNFTKVFGGDRMLYDLLIFIVNTLYIGFQIV